MGGGDLNLKKSWHPSTLRNIERVWKAERMRDMEKSKIEQLQKELVEERNKQEIRQYAEDKGVVKKKQDRLDWMYQGVAGLVDRDQYLMGRKVDKNFEILKQEEEGTEQPNEDLQPGAIFSSSSRNATVDLESKIREDPLFEIKKQEMKTKKTLLSNPVKMKYLREMLEVSLKSKNKKKKHKKKRESNDSSNDNKQEHAPEKCHQKHRHHSTSKGATQARHHKTKRESPQDRYPRKENEGQRIKKHADYKDGRPEEHSSSHRSKHRTASIHEKKHAAEREQHHKRTHVTQRKEHSPEGRAKGKLHKHQHNVEKRRRRHDSESESEDDLEKRPKVPKTGHKPERHDSSSSSEESGQRHLKHHLHTREVQNDQSSDDKLQNRSDAKRRERYEPAEANGMPKFGLIKRGSPPRKTSSRPPPRENPAKKEEKKMPVVQKRRVLSEEEKEEARRQMLENAQWREGQRKKIVDHYRKAEEHEETLHKRSSGSGGFIRPLLSKAAETGTVEGRIRQKMHTVQRDRSAMETHFARK